MVENVKRSETAKTRREVLKKAGIASVFVIPTITTFKINELAQAASYIGPPAPPTGG